MVIGGRDNFERVLTPEIVRSEDMNLVTDPPVYPTPVPTPTPPPPPTSQILTGTRVRDRVTEKLLDDVYYQEVLDSDLDTMDPPVHDDGVWPDLEEDDGIFTNLSARRLLSIWMPSARV